MNRKKYIPIFIIALMSLSFVALFAFKCQAAGFTYTPLENIPGTSSAPTTLQSYLLAVYKFAMWGVGIAALLMISVGAFMYITSAGNKSAMGLAKGYITDAIIGLVMALTAWILLNEINPALLSMSVGIPAGTTSSSSYDAGSGVSSDAAKAGCEAWCDQSGYKDDQLTSCKEGCSNLTNPTKEELQAACEAWCDQKSSTDPSCKESCKNISTTPTTTDPSSLGSGKCTAITAADNPCSAENLSSSCFASNASQASAICNAESRGDQTVLSKTDKCKDGNSFSVGLFQINLTCQCPQAFNNPKGKGCANYSCTVSDQNAYNSCVAEYSNPSTNITKACQIYKQGGWNQWGANTGTNGCGF